MSPGGRTCRFLAGWERHDRQEQLDQGTDAEHEDDRADTGSDAQSDAADADHELDRGAGQADADASVGETDHQAVTRAGAETCADVRARANSDQEYAEPEHRRSWKESVGVG